MSSNSPEGTAAEDLGLTTSDCCRLCSVSRAEDRAEGRDDTRKDLKTEEDIRKLIHFYTPIQYSSLSLFPRVVCTACVSFLCSFRDWFVRLNEGHAALVQQLSTSGVSVGSQNWLSGEKGTLFSNKFPWKALKKHKGGNGSKREKEEAEERVGKRERRTPKRFAESVRGTDLDHLFSHKETSSAAEEKNTKEETPTSPPPTELESTAVELTIDTRKKPARAGRGLCDICGKDFKAAVKLSRHRRSVHPNARYQCLAADCDKEFQTRAALNLHQKTRAHQGMEVVDPRGDGKKAKELMPPPAVPQQNGRNECGECGAVFGDRQILETHSVDLHREGRPYVCRVCSQEFPLFGDLKSHFSSSHESLADFLDFNCLPCGKLFCSPENLVEHNVVHHSSDMKCHLCFKEFKHRNILNRHIQVVHTVDRPFDCPTCNATFKSKTNLKAHLVSHTGEKRHCCDLCGKQFSYRTSLVTHLKWHEGAKPFVCPYCQKGFSQNGNLQEHIRTHTGEKPFVCTKCGKSFTTSSQHKLHEKRHTGEKPWKCEFCSKAFLHKDTWKTHNRRHKGDKPFSCDQCNKSFADQGCMKKHKRLHFGLKPYTCDVCQKSFSDCSNISKHRKTHEKSGGYISMDGDKTTVLNIISNLELPESATTDGGEISQAVTGGETQPVEGGDMHQIIYISYDEEGSKEGTIHVLEQKMGDGSLGELQLAPTSSVSDAGELVQVVSAQSFDPSKAAAAPTTEATSVSYVDVQLSEEERVRLKVPAEADPEEFANEYLQSLQQQRQEVVQEGQDGV